MRSNNNQLAPAENWPKRGSSATLDLHRKSGSGVLPSILDTRISSSVESTQRSQPWSITPAEQNASPAFARLAQNLPAEIGFLLHYGIASGILVAAAATARAQGVTADAVLLAEGKISEYYFYFTSRWRAISARLLSTEP